MQKIDNEIHAEAMAAAVVWQEVMMPAAIELGDRLGSKIHIVVFADFPGVVVPDMASREKTMVHFEEMDASKELTLLTLNVKSSATRNRAIVPDENGRLGLSFNSRFSGVDYPVFIPLAAISSVYYPDVYVPPVRIPTVSLVDWLFVNSVYGQTKEPLTAVEGTPNNVSPITSSNRPRPTLTVVK